MDGFDLARVFSLGCSGGLWVVFDLGEWVCSRLDNHTREVTAVLNNNYLLLISTLLQILMPPIIMHYILECPGT